MAPPTPNAAGEPAAKRAIMLGINGEQQRREGSMLTKKPAALDFSIFTFDLNEYMLIGRISPIRNAIKKDKMPSLRVSSFKDTNPILPPVYVAGRVNIYARKNTKKVDIPAKRYFFEEKTIFKALVYLSKFILSSSCKINYVVYCCSRCPIYINNIPIFIN